MNIIFLTSKLSVNTWIEVQPKISICFLTSKEVGVNLKQGYNGDLTSRQAGSIGGQMVKKMIESYENTLQQNGNGNTNNNQ